MHLHCNRCFRNLSQPIVLGVLSLLTLGLTPARSEFRSVPVSRTEPCSFRLSGAKTIPYDCIRWVDETVKLPFWQDSLGFAFGLLSRSQWRALTKTYGAWHNANLLLPYDPQRQYALIDFMPPTLQALDRHRFYAQQQKLGRSPFAPVQLVTNCWGTVYEVLRLAHKPQVESPILFTTAAQPMLNVLRQISALADTQKPGDIVLLSHRHGNREYLDHTVLVIDQNLFFEKAGTGNEVPYRFVTAETLQQIWNPTVFRYELRRPFAPVLPSPHHVFSLKPQSLLRLPPGDWGRWRSQLTVVEAPDEPPTLLWMQSLPPFSRVQGRFQLPASAYRALGLWPSQR